MVLIRGVEYKAQDFTDRDVKRLIGAVDRLQNLEMGIYEGMTIAEVEEECDRNERRIAAIVERVYPELANVYLKGSILTLHIAELNALALDLTDELRKDPNWVTDEIKAKLNAQEKAAIDAFVNGEALPEVQSEANDIAAIVQEVLKAKALQSK